MARPHLTAFVHPTERLVGEAPAIVALRAHIRQLVTFDTLDNPAVPTVLLQGETGTGKGLVARVIHESGPRAQGPFVEVNCAAIPEVLLEAELFGFEAGAFTDAKRAKPGLWEAASGGILFLDEIDALPLTLQSKLLTVIEAKRVRRLGAVVEHPTNVKLIAATQADLRARVAAGQFRADLYHRLAVVLLEVPPLRERGADVVLLARHYLQRAAEAYRLRPKRLDPQAEMWLQRYTWPGNVRELGHLMERVTLLRAESTIGPEALEESCLPLSQPAAPATAMPDGGDAEFRAEAMQIQLALQQTAGNVARAARLLGISRGALRHRMARYGVVQPSKEGRRSAPVPQQRVERSEGNAAGEDGQRLVPLRQEAQTLVSGWEQKPVAVLAIDVAWPEAMELSMSHTEPWTLARWWQQTIAEKMQGFGGHLVQSSASPLTVVFGLPHTLEQLPQRAVQAALAIRHLVAENGRLAAGNLWPAVRMGIHLGQVQVDVQAQDATARLSPLGETLSRPVRLLGQAAPGDILLSPEVGRLVEGWFVLHGRQGPAAAGLADAVGAYAVVGVGPRRSSLDVHGRRPLSRFVGRERELAMLADLLAEVEKERGQVVGMVGEPGVGKSRLCYEFTRVHQTHGWRILESSPAAYDKDTAYLPVVDLLKAYFQLDARGDGPTLRDKVSNQLRALDQTLMPMLPAFLTLLDLPVEDPLWQALEPPQRRQRILEACKRLWLRASQIQPLILVVENLHWIDTETQALLDSLVDSLPTARMLLLVNFRPEYQPTWGHKTYYTRLRLDPLPHEQAQELLDGLLGKDPGLLPLKWHVGETTAGNPFFLEETVQTLVETQVLIGERGSYRLAATVGVAAHPALLLPPAIRLPATVQAVLAARIDRLPPAEKRLLQAGAVIGMEVPFAVLQTIAREPEATLRRGLAQLQAAEFLYERRFDPELAYTFKHALTHEVAYGSLLHERRRAVHAQIVEALERLYPDRLDEHVERLAHHAFRGEVWNKALLYGRQAADKGMARSAYREVIVCCEQALVALRHLPAEGDTLAQGVDLLRKLYSALVLFGEFGRGLEYLREAETLAEGLGDQRRLGHILTDMTQSFWSVGDYDDAIACGQRALALTAASGDIVYQARVHGCLGTVYFSLGDYRRAIDLLRRALTAFEGEWRHERFGLGILASVRFRTWLMDCLTALGDFAEGRACGEEAIRIAEASGHLASALMPQQRLGTLALVQGDLPRSISVLEQALAQCHTAHVPLYVPGITASLGLAYALSGRSAEALPLLDQVQIRETPGMGGSSTMLRVGEAYLQVGRLNDALHLAERTLRLSSGRKERGNQAWVLWLLGEIAMHREPPEANQAERHYRQALALAQELGMRPLAAHCHLGLGTLYTKVGHQEPARAHLIAAIELYRAMDMPFWLPQAETALVQAELGSYHR